MKRYFLTLAAAVVMLWSCNAETKQTITTDTIKKTKEVVMTDAHNAQTSLTWDGTYKGVLPCADCEGIRTEITLNKDMTFVIKSNYLGKEAKVWEEKGTFKWDSKGLKIKLGGLKDTPNTYFVGENTLRQLDMQGNKITGAIADKYILKK